MKTENQAGREIEVLRERLTKLSEASLRINESLDFNNVLQEIADSARGLTKARYGGITVLDNEGRFQEFVTSGLTQEQHRLLAELPESAQFFQYLNGVEEPLRIGDLATYMRSLGMAEFRPPVAVSSLLVAPIKNGGVRVGSIYLTKGEERREFTREDEETLVMFASQGALVIANARRYTEEQRARADLETLVNTSPVGVVVFDAETGTPTSYNREALRILDGLRTPGLDPDQVLEALSVRRINEREVSPKEFPLAYLLHKLDTGQAVRAEEIVIQGPDGRSVTTLVNATAICSGEGSEMESVVMTLQDMTPLEEMERLRAEFLGMVSHELRIPLASIKGSSATLMDDSANLNPTEIRQFHRIIDEQADRMRRMIADLLDVAHIETGTLSVSPEPSDVAALVDQARHAFLSGGGRSNLKLDLPEDLPSVMADRQRIVQVLNNLLSNAANYSRESTAIRLTAVHEDVHVAVSVADEGRGVPAERLPYLFRKYSRIEGEKFGQEVGGSGLGLAICKGIVEAHGGRIWAESEGPGLGARFTFTVPVAEWLGPGEAVGIAQLSRPSRHEELAQARILVVDDDPQSLRHVRNLLSNAGYAPIVTSDPDEALRLMQTDRPRLVLLDLVMPGTDGIDLMQDILDISDVPVIFLSAYGRDQTIERAFDMGAVDYMVKPFSPTELLVRIKAALRKQAAADGDQPLGPFRLGNLAIDYDQRRVRVSDRTVHLTPIEYELLRVLSVSAGRVLTHDQLLRRVWGSANSGDPQVVRTHMRRLRRKLGDDAENSSYIFTEPGVGYRMPEPA